MSLRSQLDALAKDFAQQVVAALRGASLQELVAGGDRSLPGNGRKVRAAAGGGQPDPLATPARRGKPGRLPRRSAEDIQAGLDKIVALLRKHKEGLRAEVIRSNLGLQAKEMPRILKQGLTAKKLSSKGQKRATTYFAVRPDKS
jgi:hypothetical protein